MTEQVMGALLSLRKKTSNVPLLTMILLLWCHLKM